MGERAGTRFLAEPTSVNELKDEIGEALDAEVAGAAWVWSARPTGYGLGGEESE